ncbi:Hypothetical protein R9X50_00074700 [Acrodontium crateriforme]|uniref:Aminoglycoside phosphotransferase domain-containing protein n=1 Tax=Acrodontium crateriforme TaxID=150365 RepID=A0AAQ3LZD5_9PEZI|nr:Hypothetical protein R9X50_00074700 [Acrodontium crateriforme]
MVAIITSVPAGHSKMALSPNLPCSQDQLAIERIVTSALQTRSVIVERIQGYLYRTHRLRTQNGFFYILKSRPSRPVRLLHHEEDGLQIEASVLHALSCRSDILIPRLIDYPNAKVQRGSLHLVSGPFVGSILSDVEHSLSSIATARIEHSLGDYVHKLSTIPGPSFGAVHPGKNTNSSQTWGRTFAGMLESVMRDGEDVLINLPYHNIRDLARKHLASLDKITEPRLVIVDLTGNKNVVVDVESCKVTGLIDYSSAIWGDPFMSNAFCRPSSSFVEGFGRFSSSDADQLIRQYLYMLYHSLLAIVRHFYRPSECNDELEARRALTTAMRRLAAAAA